MRRRILLIALRDLLIVIALAGIGEGAVRLFYPQAARYIFSSTLTGGHRIVVNSDGLREEEISPAKPAGERWVLCIGNSTTFGAGLAAEDSYPQLLEEMLNASPAAGGRWRVINAGGQGTSVQAQIGFLNRKGLAFQPECVVLGFSPTMISYAGAEKAKDLTSLGPVGTRITADRSFRKFLLGIHTQLYGSYLYVLLDNHIRRRLYRWGVIRDRMDARQGGIFAHAFDVPGVPKEEVEAAYALFRSELARCRALVEERGVPLVVLNVPSRFQISSTRADNNRSYDLSKMRVNPTERVAAFCEELKIPFVDLLPRLRAEREAMLRKEKPWDDLFISLDYAHLNETGMRIAAEELAPAVRKTVR